MNIHLSDQKTNCMKLFNKFFGLTFTILFLTISPARSANYVIDLTGSGTNYVRTTSAPLNGNPTFTIEFWFNVNGVSFSDYSRILGFTGFAFEVGLTNANSGTLAVFDGSWRTSTATGMKSGWHHVAVTSNKTTMNVYVDGSQVYTKAAATFNFSGKLMYIGSDVDLGERIPGMFDEIRVWNVAKSLSEINADRVKELIGSESGLVAYYASKDDGSMTADISSTSNSLVTGGTVKRTIADFGLFLSDYAMNFTSATGSCKVASPLSGDASFTLEAQFMIPTNATTSYSRIFAWYPYAFEIAVENGTLTTYKGTWQNTSINKLNDGKWHHVAASRSGNTVKVYFDGVEVQSRTISAFNFTGAELHIGASLTSDMFPGYIDEVRVWNIASSQASIISRMKNVDQANSGGLVAYYDFNRPGSNVTSTTTVKNLVTGNPLTRTGNTQAVFNVITGKTIYPAVLSTTPSGRCGSGSVTLQATATFGSIRWFSTATGGTSLGTGNSFNTPNITTTTTYYAEAFENSVSSLSRTAIEATIKVIPTITGTTPAERCGTGTLTLGATGSQGATLNWFSAPSGGTSLGSGITYTTAALSSSVNYYVEANLAECISNSRTAVAATIKSIPNVSSFMGDSICFGGQGILSASASEGDVQWYTQSSGGTAIFVGPKFTTPEITSSAKWYAEAIANGCVSVSRQVVDADVVTFDNSVTRNGNTLNAVEPNASYRWLDCVSGFLIENAISRSYTPSKTGDYKVEITKHGCVDTSACINISVLGVHTPDKPESRFEVYPNPGAGIFKLKVPETGTYLLFNNMGQKVGQFDADANEETGLDLSELPSGMYWIKCEQNLFNHAQKLILQR